MLLTMRKSRTIALVGMFIALTVIGGLIKLPSPTGTVALDSTSAFVSALLLGPTAGALVGALGHLVSSMFVGFPLTLPIHLLIAFEMAIICAFTGLISRKLSLTITLFIALLLNGVAAPALFILVPGFGIGFFIAMVIPLIVGSGINLLITGVLVRYFKERL
ncbi:MAG TPA: ECF transporter S component [Bacillota bacterium]|nr:ECF transporter S component [Bacillota bacterium]